MDNNEHNTEFGSEDKKPSPDSVEAWFYRIPETLKEVGQHDG